MSENPQRMLDGQSPPQACLAPGGARRLVECVGAHLTDGSRRWSGRGEWSAFRHERLDSVLVLRSNR